MISRDLTKNKQTDEALRESEDCFRSVFDLAPVGIVLANKQGILIQTNQAFQEILGYTAEELQNLSFIELTHPDGQEENIKLFQELLAGKRSHFSLEKRYFRKDGCLVWVNVSVSAVCDANGLPLYAFAMIQDISAQKQAQLDLQKAHEQLEKRVTERTAELEQANTLLRQEIANRQQAQETLQESHEFLQTVLDTNPNMTFVKDREGRVILANQAYADFRGTIVEDLLGKTDADFNPNQAEVEQFRREDQEIFTTLQPKFIPEETCRTKTGEMRWYQIIKKPLFSSDGQVYGVLGVCTDITERKLLTEELKAQKDFLQTVIDTNPNKIFVKDKEGKYVLANQACADFYGMTLEQVLGKTDHQLNHNPGNIELFIAQDREVLATLQQIFIPENACRSATGEVRWYQVIKKPLLSTDGQVYQVFGVCTDITERKLAEEALRESEQRYRLLIEGMNDGVIVLDENSSISYVNEKLCEMLGYLASEMIGHPICEFVDETYLKIVQEQTLRRTRGESGSYELGLKRKYGQTLLTLASGTPMLGLMAV